MCQSQKHFIWGSCCPTNSIMFPSGFSSFSWSSWPDLCLWCPTFLVSLAHQLTAVVPFLPLATLCHQKPRWWVHPSLGQCWPFWKKWYLLGLAELKTHPVVASGEEKTLIHDSYLFSSTFRAWYIDHGSEKKQHRLFGVELLLFQFQGDRWRGGWVGRRAGQEVNNCVITSPWPGSRRELSSGLYSFSNPLPPTVPRMIARGQSRYFRDHVHILSLCHFLLIPLLRENQCGNFSCL